MSPSFKKKKSEILFKKLHMTLENKLMRNNCNLIYFDVGFLQNLLKLFTQKEKKKVPQKQQKRR